MQAVVNLACLSVALMSSFLAPFPGSPLRSPYSFVNIVNYVPYSRLYSQFDDKIGMKTVTADRVMVTVTVCHTWYNP
jgi:hypothetical protein